MSLRIAPEQMVQIEAGLARAYPEEGCGVLLGHDTGEERRVEGVRAFENRREDSRHNRYLIAPEQFLEAEREARIRGMDVVGFFHSHPDHPAEPSAFDLEHAWPWYSYLIVSVVDGSPADARAWRLAEDRSRFDPEHLELAGEPEPRTQPMQHANGEST